MLAAAPWHRLSRRGFLGLGAFVGGELVARRASASETSTELSRTASAALGALASWAEAERAELSAHVLDVLSNRTLAAAAEHRPLNPASNQKLLTLALALTALRPSYRFETSLHGRPADAGAVRELVLRGNGDPSLKTADLEQLVGALAAQGITRVQGDVFVDQSAFDAVWEPPAYGQKPNDWAAYRAPVSAVALDGNAVTLHVKATEPGSTARSWLTPPGVLTLQGSVRTVATGRETLRFDVQRQARELVAAIGGTIPVTARELATARRLVDPELAAGRALLSLLAEHRVGVAGKLQSGGAEIRAERCSLRSRPLGELVVAIGKRSDNFGAEMLLKAIGAHASGGAGTSAAGASAIAAYLNRIGAWEAGTKIVNGSGLYDANRVSAASITRLLAVVGADRDIGNEFIASLPVGGTDGTLAERFQNFREPPIVRAKTGTLSDVTALSGFILRRPPDGPLAFSVLINRVGGKVREARRRLDDAIEAIARAT
jgi:D-alanyl-D-alanine carboxypeptidase/D-alanyl-D-alanine-endopeptidase (penicillin-binding protein 4)